MTKEQPMLRFKQRLWSLEKGLLYRLPRPLAHRWYYRRRTGKTLSLKAPQDFNEKLQWLIVYRYGEGEARFADKLAVRDYVAEQGLEGILPKVYGIYDHPEDMDWEALPQRFVLKTNHGSGPDFYALCPDKSRMDRQAVAKKMQRALKKNFAKMSLEYHYAHVRPKIFAEEFLQAPEDTDLPDYKVFCFHGEPRYILVTSARQTELKRDYFDLDWHPVPLVKERYRSARPPEKPENLKGMLDIARMLSKPFAFVRVDLYNLKGRIVFGELTLSPATGINLTYTENALRHLGDLVDLSKVPGARP